MKRFCLPGLLGLLFSIGYAQEYLITELGTLGGTSSGASAINNHGQVVGGAYLPNNSSRAVLWENGAIIRLVLDGDEYIPSSSASDINDAGQIVGNINWGETIYGFIWENGVTSVFSNFNGKLTAINNHGDLAGFTYSRPNRAFIRKRGTLTYICDPPGYFGKVASAINDRGQVIGYTGNTDSAFLWESEICTTIVTSSNHTCAANGINNSGQVVGDDNGRAFLWENGVYRDLGMYPGYRYTTARKINNRGQIIGYAGGENGPEYIYLGLIWKNGSMIPLQSLIDPNSGWDKLIPKDINDKGQIVGNGKHNGQTRAFLMTPIPTGDVDRNGCVEQFDLTAVIAEFGNAPTGTRGKTDVTGDGIVDDFDLAQVIFHFGEGC